MQSSVVALSPRRETDLGDLEPSENEVINPVSGKKSLMLSSTAIQSSFRMEGKEDSRSVPQLTRSYLTRSASRRSSSIPVVFSKTLGSSIALLVIVIFTLLAYLIMQCLPVLDVMVGIVGVRSYLGITQGTQIALAIVGLLILAYAISVFVEITCCWERLLSRTLRRLMGDASKSVWRRLFYFVGYDVQSPRFIVRVWLESSVDLIFQFLLLRSLAHEGFSPSALIFFASVLLFNSIFLVLYATVTAELQRDRDKLGKRLATLGLLDSICDLTYSLFPFVNLIIQYAVLYAADNKLSGKEKRMILVVQARLAFLGGNNWWELFLKMVTRLKPLFSIPYRLRETIIRRHIFVAHAHRMRKVQKQDEKMKELCKNAASSLTIGDMHIHKADIPTSTEPPSTSTEPPSDIRDSPLQRSRTISTSSRMLGQAVRTVSNATIPKNSLKKDDGRAEIYTALPWKIAVAPGIFALAIWLFVIARLAPWKQCDVPLIAKSCEIPQYDIFEYPASTEATRHQACQCITLLHHERNCSDERQVNTTSRSLKMAGPTNKIRVAVIQGCPGDTSLLDVLLDRVESPWALDFTGGGGRSVQEVPKAFHERVGSLMFSLALHDVGLDSTTAHEQIFTKMPKLVELDLSRNWMASLPSSVARLSSLDSLRLSHNELKSLPDALGELTGLRRLYLGANNLTVVPESFRQLQNLKDLELEQNRLTTLPDLEHLTRAKYLYFSRNQITSFPDKKAVQRLPGLRLLDMASNNVTTLPLDWNLKSAGSDEAAIWHTFDTVVTLNQNPVCRSSPWSLSGATELGKVALSSVPTASFLCADDYYGFTPTSRSEKDFKLFLTTAFQTDTEFKCKCPLSGVEYWVAGLPSFVSDQCVSSTLSTCDGGQVFPTSCGNEGQKLLFWRHHVVCER